MKPLLRSTVLSALTFGLLCASWSDAQVTLLAAGTLDQSRAGSFVDLSGLAYPLENGVRGNELGGFGSGITYVSGNEFLAIPDRGPNAVSYASGLDDTVSYINRFHAITMDLKRNESGTGLPFVIRPKLKGTTLLWSATPLVYGSGFAVADPDGNQIPNLNQFFVFGFTERDLGGSRFVRQRIHNSWH